MDFFTPFVIAVQMLAGFDADLYEIIGLSLRVSVVAVSAALLLGLPLGALSGQLQLLWARGGGGGNQHAAQPAAGGGRAGGLSFDLALGPAGVFGPALFPHSDDDGPVHSGSALVNCAVTPGV